MVHSLRRLFASRDIEITRGRYNLGTLVLIDSLRDVYRLEVDCPVILEIETPDIILDNIRNSREYQVNILFLCIKFLKNLVVTYTSQRFIGYKRSKRE